MDNSPQATTAALASVRKFAPPSAQQQQQQQQPSTCAATGCRHAARSGQQLCGQLSCKLQVTHGSRCSAVRLASDSSQACSAVWAACTPVQIPAQRRDWMQPTAPASGRLGTGTMCLSARQSSGQTSERYLQTGADARWRTKSLGRHAGSTKATRGH